MNTANRYRFTAQRRVRDEFGPYPHQVLGNRLYRALLAEQYLRLLNEQDEHEVSDSTVRQMLHELYQDTLFFSA